jgi:NAD(P)-dependent dehydrogenase (short-subunit alcohol dehydrogenase family)
MSEGSNTFIVTGAGGGVGAAAVRQLAEREANVLAVDIDAPALETTLQSAASAKGEVVTCRADVTSEDEVRAYVSGAVERWGSLAGIFNIAGIEGDFQMTGGGSTENYRRVMDINALSVFLNMKYVLPQLERAGGGAVVNVGSHLAWHGAATLGPYCASKHAVVGLTKAAALEYAEQEIRCNVVCPSSIETAMAERVALAIDPEDPVAGKQVLIDQSPNMRLASADEVAGVGVWLLLDAPRHITGIIIPVDGGQSARAR